MIEHVITKRPNWHQSIGWRQRRRASMGVDMRPALPGIASGYQLLKAGEPLVA